MDYKTLLMHNENIDPSEVNYYSMLIQRMSLEDDMNSKLEDDSSYVVTPAMKKCLKVVDAYLEKKADEEFYKEFPEALMGEE